MTNAFIVCSRRIHNGSAATNLFKTPEASSRLNKWIGLRPAGFSSSAHQISYCFKTSTLPHLTSGRHRRANRAGGDKLRESLRTPASGSQP